MIANWSRLNQFDDCARKAFNWDELRLSSWREADPLITGGGFHVGAATFFSTKNLEQAQQAVERDIRERLSTQLVLEEERPVIEQQIEWAKRAVATLADNYDEEEIRVLWPEVEFCEAMPNSVHHCFFAHRILHPDVPYADCQEIDCRIPHYFRGKTDAIVQWNTKVWLFEHKTNASKVDEFLAKFMLDGQTTGYIYGASKSLGVPIQGVIVNVLQKPYKNARDQLQVGFARDVFMRSNEDLTRFEREFVTKATDYETKFMQQVTGANAFAITMSTNSCMKYSRKCYYHEFCQRGFDALPDEFRERDPDYVESAYRKILHLEETITT